MKSARYYGISDVRFEEIAEPMCGDHEVKIKIAYAGICGSDLHIYRKGMFIQNIPETMGHEFVGVISDVGDKVTKYKVGDPVTANPMVPCMTCDSCRKGKYNTCESLGFIGEVRQGCYAEYIVMTEDKIIPIHLTDFTRPEDLKKYVLIEPLAVAVNVMRRAKFDHQDKIAIFGAGPIGCLVTALAKQIYGVSSVTVVDLSEERLVYAKRAGADVVLTDEKELDFDYTGTVDCAGVPQTIEMAGRHIAADGKLCIVSIFEKEAFLTCNSIVEKQLQVIGCNVYMKEDLQTAGSLLGQEGFDIMFLITHIFSLEKCGEAFELLAGSTKSAQKVVFQICDSL